MRCCRCRIREALKNKHFNFDKCPAADLLIPFADTNRQDLCLDVTVTAALKVVTCNFSFGIKGLKNYMLIVFRDIFI